MKSLHLPRIAAVLFITLLLPGCAEKRIAVVNGSPVLKEDYLAQAERYIASIEQQGQVIPEPDKAQIRSGILQSMIEQELILQDARKENFSVPEDKIQTEWESFKNQFPSETEFKDAVAQWGFSEKALRTQMRNVMTIQDYLDSQFEEAVQVTEPEISSYYNANLIEFSQPRQVRASHILILVDPTADEATKAEARREIEMIQGKLEQGGNFASLAREFSQGPSAPQGGDLGFFSRGQMVPPFEEAAFSLSIEEISEIIETQFGYHIIQATDSTADSTIPLSDAHDQIEEYLGEQKRNQVISDHVQKLRDAANIEIIESDEQIGESSSS